MKKIIFLSLLITFLSCKNADNKKAERNKPSEMVVDSKTKDLERTALNDQFKIDYSLKDHTLKMSLNTNIPNQTEVSISVDRHYWEVGDDISYFSTIEYVSEFSTVEQWKKEHTILIDENKWKLNLAKKRDEFAKNGMGAEIAKISDSIEINVVFPDPNNTAPIRKGKSILLLLPFSGKISKNSKYTSYNSLLKNNTYSVSKKIPLMSEINPADPMNSLEKMRKIKAGSFIKILEVEHKGSFNWYKVKASNPKGNIIGYGWVNSAALMSECNIFLIE